jgi:LemA protein
MNRFRLIVSLAAAVLLAACGINTVPAKEEVAKAKWADVQAQYQRRADLIPQLVGAVKGAAAQEKGTLIAVTEARASATRIQVTGEQLSDPAAMARYAEAQTRLSTSILAVQRLQEAYPDLKTNTNFLDLQSQIEGTANRITVALRDYNEAVRDYNTEIRTFPSLIGAKFVHGAKALTPYTATSADATTAPKVEF